MARDENKRQLAITDKDISEINSISGELTTKRITLQDLEARLHSKDYARDEQSEVASIDGELKELAYDPAAHTRISQDRVKLQTFEKLNTELTEARLQNETQLKIKEDSLKAISLIQAELTNLSGQGSQIQKELAMLPQISAQLVTLDARLSEFNNKERVARDKLAELSEKLKQLDDFAADKIAKETLLRSCSEAEGIYSELVKIFSKRGIQALIIEETIPEIENEANLLLGKMTDNRMSISLETQKDTKKGSTVETLDIKIADELGTRSYEMYSGGEAFRIDLALRIAISRLLVRRAGASMPILIIDEGFGTQDNAGIEKLVEAINSIQDDFEKVFVITHLDEIKDRFPVLINITKTAEGSMITLNQ
jgi:exonuclease SbcC